MKEINFILAVLIGSAILLCTGCTNTKPLEVGAEKSPAQFISNGIHAASRGIAKTIPGVGDEYEQQERDEAARVMLEAQKQKDAAEEKAVADQKSKAEEVAKQKQDRKDIAVWGKDYCNYSNRFGKSIAHAAESVARRTYRNESVTVDDLEVKQLENAVRQYAPLKLSDASLHSAVWGMVDACASPETLSAL